MWRFLTHPTCICRPRMGWSCLNFAVNFGVRKLESSGYRAMLFAWSTFSRLIQYRSVTDTQADRQTHDDGIYRAYHSCRAVKMAKHRITQIMPHESPTTLVFWHQTSRQNSNGNIPYGGDKCRWGGLKLAAFDERRAITRKWHKIDA